MVEGGKNYSIDDGSGTMDVRWFDDLEEFSNFQTGESIDLFQEDVALSVRASASIPWIFKPTRIGSILLCDGGLSNPLPDNVVKEMGADIVIAVNLDNESYFNSEKYRRNNLYLSSLKSIQFLQYNLGQECIK